MRKLIYFLFVLTVFSSCGSKTETGVVGIRTKSFEYNFNLYPSYTLDSSVKSFTAKLSLYSDFEGHTQFTCKMNGTKPGKSYIVSMVNTDTTKAIGIADTVYFGFKPVLAIDNIEYAYSGIQMINLDSFVNYYKGYLIISNPLQSNLTDDALLIKGKIR